MKLRFAFIPLLCLATLASRGNQHVVRAQGMGDVKLVQTASRDLSTHSRTKVIQWLRAQPTVASVALGLDAQTIDLTFRDGLKADIVPAAMKAVGVGRQIHVRPSALPHQTAHATALVAEPFASELGLGAGAGDVEVQALTQAGFGVTQLYDTQVTVASMLTLAQYNVVYMHTHSGVSQSGRGVVATGEPANTNDPAVAPYVADGTVVIVGVAGSTQAYYAITSSFITLHEPQFRVRALVFINGCSLLSTPDFGQALLARGVGVLISWDKLGTAQDDFLSAAALFNVMAQGQSVSAAITTILAAGYGVSHYQGATSTIGFQGDGGMTLASTTQPTGPPPNTPTPPIVLTAPPKPTVTAPPPPTFNTSTPVPPTETPVPTRGPGATSTPRPTLTATSIPVPSLQASLRSAVVPGQTQVVSARFAPNTPVRFRVVFPNGDVRQTQKMSDAEGKVSFDFLQHASKISRESNLATVQVSVPNSTVPPVTVHYRIEWADIDIAVEPRVQRPGKTVVIWVHSQRRRTVSVAILVHGKAPIHLDAITGPDGWADLVHKVSAHARRQDTVTVRAQVRLRGHNRATSSTYRVS